MQVAVFADLEGAFGIWRMRQCRSGTAEWQYGRQCLTADVNQVIAGAFDAGAQCRTCGHNGARGNVAIPGVNNISVFLFRI